MLRQHLQDLAFDWCWIQASGLEALQVEFDQPLCGRSIPILPAT